MQLIEAQVLVKTIYNVTKGTMKPQTLPMRQKGRYSDSFVYIISGRTRYDFANYHFTVQAGDILYLARGSCYAMDVQEDYRFIYIDFDFADAGGPLRSTYFTMQAYEHLEKIFRRMERRWLPDDFSSRLQCFADLYEIYAALLERQFKRYVSSDKVRLMNLAEATIQERFTDAGLTVLELAGQAGMSEVHFRRLFRRVYHVSPLQFITSQRIRRAKELLIDGSLTIGQVADAVGYASVYYFSRIFKQVTGLTPSGYRQKVP